jgi:hypothetical protein
MNGETTVPKIQMEVIPEPAPNTASILKLAGPNFATREPFAVIKGVGDTDYVCGTCRVTIASHVERGQLVNMVLFCVNCGSYNIIRGT